MTSFEQRLSQLPYHNAPYPGTSGKGRIVKQAKMATSTGPSMAVSLLAIPIGAFLGALAVVAGGILEVNFIRDVAVSMESIAPPLSFVTFAVAIVLSFLMDKVFRGAWTGRVGVTVGFVAMMWGELELASMYPKIWTTLYDVDNYSIETFTALIG